MEINVQEMVRKVGLDSGNHFQSNNWKLCLQCHSDVLWPSNGEDRMVKVSTRSKRNLWLPLRGVGLSTPGDWKEMVLGDPDFTVLSVQGCCYVPGLSISSRPWPWQEANPIPL